MQTTTSGPCAAGGSPCVEVDSPRFYTALPDTYSTTIDADLPPGTTVVYQLSARLDTNRLVASAAITESLLDPSAADRDHDGLSDADELSRGENTLLSAVWRREARALLAMPH